MAFVTDMRRLPPSVQAFSALKGVEAVVRGTTLSVFPLLMYRVYGDAVLVSEIYFAIGLLSLFLALWVPRLVQILPRRRAYELGIALYFLSGVFGLWTHGPMVTLAVIANTLGATTCFICHNAYVMEHVDRQDLSRMESLRLFYGAIGWTGGPFLGVYVMSFWPGLPFLITMGASFSMFLILTAMNFGPARVIQRQRPHRAHPAALLHRFSRQPRLIAGWLFMVIRSSAWWVFIVYVGIFAVEKGLSAQVGGIATSLGNASLALAPLLLRWVRRFSVRWAVRVGFLVGAFFFMAAGFAAALPWLTIALLMAATLPLVWLDLCAGLPFLMAVKPSERTEMSAIYGSFRDVSGIVTPGVAWVTLQFAPVEGVFVACGGLMLLAFLIASALHPELGVPLKDRARRQRL